MPAPTLVVGAPCWIDLYSSDTDKAKEFYGQLFGWTPEEAPPEFGGYFTFLKDGKHVAGCMLNDGSQNAPDSWTVHLMTDDIERTVEAARTNGGQVHVEPMDVGDNGRFAMIGDPGQAGIGAWEPKTVKGFEVRNEPGVAAWFELHTRDYDKSVEFYRDVFGWDTHAMSDTSESATRPRARATTRSPGSWTRPTTRPRARPRRGRSISRWRTSTPRSSRSSLSAGRSSGRPRTRRTAGWLPPPIPPARASS